MEILSSEIRSTFMVEIVTASILTVLILFMSMTMIHLVVQNEKTKGKKRISGFILVMVCIVTTLGWMGSLDKVYEYEIVEAKVDDWNEVHKEDWEIVSKSKEMVELKRKIKE